MFRRFGPLAGGLEKGGSSNARPPLDLKVGGGFGPLAGGPEIRKIVKSKAAPFVLMVFRRLGRSPAETA